MFFNTLCFFDDSKDPGEKRSPGCKVNVNVDIDAIFENDHVQNDVQYE